MQICPDYVPNPLTNAIPNNIAGEYYTIYKLAVPRTGDYLDAQVGYVQLVVSTLKDDPARLQAVLELLQTLRGGDVDERHIIYEMAKLVNTMPPLFIGLAGILQYYTIERRNLSNLSYKKTFREAPVVNFQGQQVANLGHFYEKLVPDLPPECQGAIAEYLVELGNKRRHDIAVAARRVCLASMQWPYALQQGLLLLGEYVDDDDDDSESDDDDDHDDDAMQQDQPEAQPNAIMAKEEATYMHTLANCRALRALYALFVQSRPERESRADMCKFYTLTRGRPPTALDDEDAQLRALVDRLDSMLLTAPPPPTTADGHLVPAQDHNTTSMLFKFKVRCDFLNCLRWVNQSASKLDVWAQNSAARVDTDSRAILILRNETVCELLLKVRAVVQTVNMHHTRQYCRAMIATYERYISERNGREFIFTGFAQLYPEPFRAHNMQQDDELLQSYVYQLQAVLRMPGLHASAKFDAGLAAWAQRGKQIKSVVPPAPPLVQRVHNPASDPHPKPLVANMQHIDELFDMARVRNDADINYIMRCVQCFREFAKRYLFEADCDVERALAMIRTVLGSVTQASDTQQKIATVHLRCGISQREALQRLVFCNMNVDAAVQNKHQDAAALQITQLIHGCSEDRAQQVLREQHNDVNQAVEHLLSLADADAAPSPRAQALQYFMAATGEHAVSAKAWIDAYNGNADLAIQQFHAKDEPPDVLPLQRFMAATGEEAESAATWLQTYNGNAELAAQQFHENDEAATRAGRIVIDATAATMGLKSVEVPGSRGHCFYLCMSQQLSLHGVQLTFQQLRAITADEIAKSRLAGAMSHAYPIYSAAIPPHTMSFADWCASVAVGVRYSGPEPVWADNLTIQSLLIGLFKKDVVVRLRIIASRRAASAAGNCMELTPLDANFSPGADICACAQGNLKVFTLTIGHVYGRHYVGTVPVATCSSPAVTSAGAAGGSSAVPQAHATSADDGSEMNVDILLPDISALGLLSEAASRRQQRAPASIWARYNPPAASSGSTSRDVAATAAALEQWKLHSAYPRWAHEAEQISLYPLHCTTLFDSLETQRFALYERVRSEWLL